MNKWDQIIKLRRFTINSIRRKAAKEKRLLSEHERIEIDYYLDQIERYGVYSRVGI